MPNGNKNKGKDPATVRNESKQFYAEYLSSPNYKKRLIAQGYEDPKEVIKRRSKRLKTDKFKIVPNAEGGSEYVYPNEVIYDPTQAESNNLPVSSTIAHEYSHLTGSDSGDYTGEYTGLNTKETNEIARRNRASGTWPEHDSRPWEAKADLDALRFRLKSDKIYNTGTQNFDKRLLKQAKERYGKDEVVNRLFKNFSDDDLIYLMNNIAENNQIESTIAKNGGYMKARPKYFEYSSLPSSKKKKKIMAAQGLFMSPEPRIPGLYQSLQDYYQGDSPIDMNPSIPRTTPIGSIDTNKVKPGQLMGENLPLSPRESQRKGSNWADAPLYGLALADALIPARERPGRQQVVEPGRGYNPYPYGTGSQAMMANGGYMEDGGATPPKKRKGPITEYTHDPSLQAISDILVWKNRNKNFIDRVVNPGDKPVVQTNKLPGFENKGIPDWQFSSQLMASDYDKRSGKGKVYPMLVQRAPGMQLEFLNNPDKAYNYADSTGEYVETPSYKVADYLSSQGYKLASDNLYGTNYRQYMMQHENGGNVSSNNLLFQEMMRNSVPANIDVMKKGGWIQKATDSIKRRGTKGVCTGSKFGSSSCPPGSKRYNLAKTFKKMAKKRKGKAEDGAVVYPWMLDEYQEGGIIPDNMSPFSPKKYKNGGSSRGGSDTMDLLEQWIPWMTGEYEYGGPIPYTSRGGCDTFDLLEQHIPWRTGEYRQGGTLSPGKAKEMLKDGTAHGKKLTKKQKQYFGMVAAGKADLGADISGDPEKPSLVRDVKQLRGDRGIRGTDAWGNKLAMDFDTQRTAHGIDLVNSVVSSGLLPHQTSHAKDLRDQLNPAMYNYLYQFNQRQDVHGMTPEQRVRAFYDIQSNDPAVQSLKSTMKTYGYGPIEFRRTQGLMPAERTTTPPIAGMKTGGIMYDNGGEIGTLWGGDAELESYNPYDGGTVEFNGASHEDGGIGMHYNGNPVEVEGGEYASMDDGGNLNIYGNMHIPGTRTKFKAAAGAMADKEKRYGFLKNRGAELVNNSNPANKFEQLAFNSGRVMMMGGDIGQADIANKKKKLSALQRAMLDVADEYGLDPQSMSQGKMKKAKGGASIPFFEEGGDPDDPWIRKILEYEATRGSAKGKGLSNWGYNSRNPKNIDEAINFFKQDYLPKVQQYPMGLRERVADFLYNTGKDPRVALLAAAGKIPDVNTRRAFYNGQTSSTTNQNLDATWNQYSKEIENMYSDPEFIKRFDRARDTYYQNINQVNDKPNPAYEATWKGRLGIFDPVASNTNFDTRIEEGNDPTRADKNYNPGNIKYGKFAQKYGARKDKDGFAIFPNRNSGLQAMKDLLKSPSYKNLSINDAIDKWTGNKPYNYNLDDIAHKSVGSLSTDEFDRLVNTMQKGEGTRYGSTSKKPTTTPTSPSPSIPVPKTFTPYTLPDVPLTPNESTKKVSTTEPPPLDKIQVPGKPVLPSNVEPLHASNILGEIYGAATNRVEPVPVQRYEPELYSPYQVSFQDRLNQNQASYNAMVKGMGASNPSALGTLAAQKYAADSAVKADEFRANQAIANDIVNKNISLTNDAQLKNLALADQQMVRQSQARSKTRELNQMIVNSLSSKYAQNDYENKRLAAYENLYDYRFVPGEKGGLKATYFGPNALFNFDPRSATQRNSDLKTVSKYDQYGNLKGYTQYDDNELMDQERLLNIEKKRRSLPLMSVPPLQ